MKNGSRDLLFMSKSDEINEQAFEHELQCLNNILYQVESFSNFSLVNEIIDVNAGKVIRKKQQIQRILLEKKHKPFVFIYNKN
jgi:hypothetical protein